MKRIALPLRQFTAVLLVAALLPFTSGCLTSKLWSEGGVRSFAEPATNASVKIFQSRKGDDVLVQYDETLERKEHRVRHRAFFLNANAQRLDAKARPSFVHLDQAAGLQPIPLLASPPARDAAATNLYATLSTNGFTVTIFSGMRPLKSFPLPVYEDNLSRAQRLGLTPLTVLADLTIIGGIIGIILAPALDGASFTL